MCIYSHFEFAVDFKLFKKKTRKNISFIFCFVLKMLYIMMTRLHVVFVIYLILFRLKKQNKNMLKLKLMHASLITDNHSGCHLVSVAWYLLIIDVLLVSHMILSTPSVHPFIHQEVNSSVTQNSDYV